MTRSVLFVCTANVCRSPMAEAILKNRVATSHDRAKWHIESAGTWGMDGSEMAEGVKKVLAEQGIPFESHAARTVDREMLAAFNLILTMEKGHKEALRSEFPEFAGKIYVITEMVGEKGDIGDPIGQPIEAYRFAVKRLSTLLEKGFNQIKLLSVDRKRK